MTMLAVKLDENLGRTHVEFLRRAGYTADRVHDEGLSGETDDVVWQRVCATGCLFITLDLDFGAPTAPSPPGTSGAAAASTRAWASGCR